MSDRVCSTPAWDLRVGSRAAPPTLRELAPRPRKTGHWDIWGKAVTGYCDHSFNLNIQATSQRAIHDFIDHAVLCEPRTLWLTSRLRKFLQAYLSVKRHGRNVYGCSRDDLLNQGGAVSAGRVFASQRGSPSCQFKEWRVQSRVVSCLSDNPGCCACVAIFVKSDQPEGQRR